MAGETVLVTGGTGFIGAHCIIQLLQQGYKVRTTVRALKREGDVRNMLKVGGADAAAPIQFYQADLSSDDGWTQAGDRTMCCISPRRFHRACRSMKMS